ncbi:transposase-like protein [Catenulispora sp. GP43]
MTVLTSVPAGDDFERQLAAAEPDMLRAMVKSFAEALMSAEADAICGAEYGQSSPERTNSRNGYRTRPGTPGSAASNWRCPSCARARTSQSGCWSGAAALSRR